MSKIRNALKSVRVKLFMTLSLVILLIILFLIIVNNFVFGQFYIYSKTKSLISVYDLVNSYYNGEVEGDITSQLEKMAIQNNFDILIKNDQNFKEYLKLQNYDSEIDHLREKYGLPDGRLYIVEIDNTFVGCIGLKRIDNQNCEMKRLYVKP